MLKHPTKKSVQGLTLPILAAGISALLATSPARGDHRDDDDEYPTDVTLRSLAYAGTGCPADTVRLDVPVDGREFLIFYGGFAASAGPDVPLRDSRKNCQLNIDLGYPEGWQYTLVSVDYDGQHELGQGVVATAASAYYFQGSPDTVRAEHEFVGPLTGDYQVVDQYPEDQLQWSTCDATRSLNINVQVRIDPSTARDSRGVISFTDTPDMPGSQLILKWRRC